MLPVAGPEEAPEGRLRSLPVPMSVPMPMPVGRSQSAWRQPLRAPVAVRLLGLLAGLAMSGCIGFGRGPTIRRTVGGQERAGIFVSPYSYEHFLRGELAAVAGDLQLASEEYRLARAGPEDDPLLIARLADVVDQLGREDEALALLAQGDELDPSSELIALARGQVHERHGRLAEAIEAYSRAASVAPGSESGPIALSAALRAEERPDEADAVLQRYLERGHGAGAARARLALAIEHEDAQAAAEAVRALLEVAPARAFEVRAAVRTALDADRPELAARLIAGLPDVAEDRSLRLRVAIASGDDDRAEGLLASWMPRGPGELIEVADGYLAIGIPARAIELAQVALSADGGAPARLVLGRALHAAGRLGEAASALAGIEPGSQAWPAAPTELARVLADAGMPALAADVLAHAMHRRGSPELALALSEAREEAGDADGAIAEIERDALALRAARAELLDRLGREGTAEAFAALPSDRPELSTRVRARAAAERQWREGEREAAIASLSAWTDRAPEDLRARARLAEMLSEAGRAEPARTLAAATLRMVTDDALEARLHVITDR